MARIPQDRRTREPENQRNREPQRRRSGSARRPGEDASQRRRSSVRSERETSQRRATSAKRPEEGTSQRKKAASARKKKAARQRRILLGIILVLVLVLIIWGCAGHGKKADKDPAAGNGGETQQTEEQQPKRSAEDQAQLDQDIADGYLILVNKSNYLPSTYEPQDLEGLQYYAEDRSPDARFMRAKATQEFHRMVEDARAEGIDIVSTTAYRSYGFQEYLYNYYVSSKGQEEADRVSAKPGSSEHQTGLTADLSTSEIGNRNGSEFGNTAAGKWIAEHCWEYGFIVRYPEGKEGITGYSYEPWHVRYVGPVAAKEIFNEGITLDEYIEENEIPNVDIVEPQN